MRFFRHLISGWQVHTLPELLIGRRPGERIARRERGFHHQRAALGG